MPVHDAKQECLSPDERAQQQLERLQSTLNRAFKNVPFYRDRFQEQGIDPLAVEALADLRRLPFTRRLHLSEHYPYDLFAVPLRDIMVIHTAPGTTTRPTVSGYTKSDMALWRTVAARALTASGVAAVDVIQVLLDTGLANWGRDYKNGAELIEACVIPLTFLPSYKQIMVLSDYKTSILITSPSAAEEIAELLKEADLGFNALSLRALILVGDPPDPALRGRLEEELRVQTWVHYGLSEVPGPALAFECERHAGLHVSEDHFLPEVIDPASGEVLHDGEVGELVLTTLTSRAFPLIRFRTGDRVRLLHEPCECGRTFRRMEWLPERTDEMVVIRGVKLHFRQVKMLLERALGGLPELHRFVVRREKLRDFLEIRLAVQDLLFSDEIKELEARVRGLRADLAQDLGVPVEIRLLEAASFGPMPPPERIEDERL
jgi:phenylacetate-CoA ligase